MRYGRSIFAILFPLLAVAGSADAQFHDLRGPAPKQGTIVQSRTEMSMPAGTLTIEVEGTVTRAKAIMEDVSTSELEVVQTDGKQLTMLRYRFAEDWTKTSFEHDGQTSQEVIEDDPLIGETVLIEQQDGSWRKTLLGREPNERQKAWLREPFTDNSELYPANPVAIGGTWVLEGPKLAALFGFNNVLSADGKATFTLDRVITEDGDPRAAISYRLELRGRMLDVDNSLVDFTLGGSGKVHRSLTSYLDVSSHLTGQQHFSGSVTEGGKKTNLTIAGPIEVKGSERLVTSGSRAEVVHRAKAPQATSASAALSPTQPAARQPPQSAQVERSCKGTAVACWQRNSLTCSTGFGCSDLGSCGGVAVASCFGKPQYSCSSTPGCYWQSWSRTCGGTITCFGKSSFDCAATSGCRWQTQCQGNAAPCSSLNQGQCWLQPGCSFE